MDKETSEKLLEARRHAESERQAAEEAAAREAAERQAAEEAAAREAAERQAAEEAAGREAAERQAAEEEQPADNFVYPNCTAVKEAGAAPIYRGDPGWQDKLDRDGDGVACAGD